MSDRHHHHHINPGHILYHADHDDEPSAGHDHNDTPPCRIDDGSAFDHDDYRGADYDGPTVDHSPTVI